MDSCYLGTGISPALTDHQHSDQAGKLSLESMLLAAVPRIGCSGWFSRPFVSDPDRAARQELRRFSSAQGLQQGYQLLPGVPRPPDDKVTPCACLLVL